MTRANLPLWEAWEAYFSGCEHGTALPIIHTQYPRDGSSRAALSDMVAPQGGVLVPANQTQFGNPRFSFLMLSIEFSLFRAAGRVRGVRGCQPRFIQLLSESDVPAANCLEVHSLLANTPNMSRIDAAAALLLGPHSGVPFDYQPLGKASPISSPSV